MKDFVAGEPSVGLAVRDFGWGSLRNSFHRLKRRINPHQSNRSRATNNLVHKSDESLCSVPRPHKHRSRDGSQRSRHRSSDPILVTGIHTSAGVRRRVVVQRDLTDALPSVVFVLDAEGLVRLWNRAAEEFTDTPREDVLGTTAVSMAFYHDDRRTKTLADKIVEAPESADEVFDVTRSTGAAETRYGETNTMVMVDGEEIDAWFTASPVYEDSEFAGVVETVQDRTDRMRQEATEALVADVNETLMAIGGGDLSTRATYEDADDVLELESLGVVTEVNETAGRLRTAVSRVEEHTTELVSGIEGTAQLARDIEGTAATQHENRGQ